MSAVRMSGSQPRPRARAAVLAAAVAAALGSAALGSTAIAQTAHVAQVAHAAATSAAATPAPATLTAAEFAAQRAAARAASERRDWADALPRWQALEAAAPTDTDLLIESARVHGFADRNAQAAERYRKVLELAPGRRGDVLLSLAWQTLWTGQPAAAEPLFLEVAERPAAYAGGGDGFDAWRGLAEARRNAGRLEAALESLARAQALRPDDRDIARQAAQTHAWLDRHDEAIARYSALVASDPSDRWSRYGLAQARNFHGLHRAAVAGYREAFEADRAAGRTPPPDALFDHARALRWAGYDDLAHDALDGLLQPDARWLRDWRTGREQRPWASAAFEAATDRDELDTRAATASFGWRPGPVTSVEVGTRLVDLEEPGRDARGERLGVTLRTRFGSDAAGIGSAADRGPIWPSLSLAANRYGGWHPVTGAARVRWDPKDTLRLDAELAREVVETPLAISNRVTVDVAALGALWRWQPRSSVSATLAALEFDDGNLRTRLNLGANHTLRLNPKVVVGVEAMVFRSSDPTSELRAARGYWNPRDYREARAFVALEHEVRAWAFGLRLGVGSAREKDGWGNRSSGDPNLWELSAGYDLAPSLRLRAWAGGSGGSMGVGSGGEGYWRRFAGIGITGWF